LVYRRLAVLDGKKDAYGLYTEKPEIALAYDPDAVVEMDTYTATAESAPRSAPRSP
jgi:hypothetical protein